MNWFAWIVFCVELIFKLAPYVRDLAQWIAEQLDLEKDINGEPLSGEQKQLKFDAEFTRTMTAKKGKMPTETEVAMAREWNLQKIRGKKWKAAPQMATKVGLDKFYA